MMNATCAICHNLIEPDDKRHCSKHGIVCGRCWDWDYKRCVVCADREYEYETHRDHDYVDRRSF